jgi:hypothetical protein
MTEGLPVEILEKRAAEQRRQIHETVLDLRGRLKERLDVKRNVRDRLGPVAGGMALLGLAIGYAFAGAFTRE